MNSHIIKRPIITEKTLDLANQQNIYTFEVDYQATKTQVITAIEGLFEVEVERVNTVVTSSKRRRTGKNRRLNISTAKKKALIKLKKGQTIELFDVTA